MDLGGKASAIVMADADLKKHVILRLIHAIFHMICRGLYVKDIRDIIMTKWLMKRRHSIYRYRLFICYCDEYITLFLSPIPSIRSAVALCRKASGLPVKPHIFI